MAYQIETSTLWEESEATSARSQAQLLQQVAGGPAGYRLCRIILTNFWLYEHQEFDIPHGRLFLAGDNRSGKSTVLTAAITLALDGDFHPERIDTFGKREKRIDYYILGSNESNTPFIRDQRTSYIALEFEWCGMDQPPFASELRARWERGEREQAHFLTIGVAFHGNRNSANPITPLRFLITDGSRLEYTIRTVLPNLESKERRASDLKTFKKELTEHGLVCETQREYEQKVAQYLFNFAVDDFQRLIRQLLYLRQPNLTNILSLETVRSYLDQSLPSLPPNLIQRAANTLELMDSLKEEIERQKKAYSAVEKLHRAQQIVTMAKARLASCEYIRAQLTADTARAEVQRLKRNITRADNELNRHLTHIKDLEEEQIQLNSKISALEGSAGLQAAQRLSQANDAVVNREKDLAEQRQILDDAVEHREQASQQSEAQQVAFAQSRQECEQLLLAMQQMADQEAYWQIAAEQVAELLGRLKVFSLDASLPDIPARISSLHEVSVQERLKWLGTLRQLHREIEQLNTKLQAAQQQETAAYEALDEGTRQFEQRREEVSQAQQALADSLDSLLDESDWLLHLVALNERAALCWNETVPARETVMQFGAILQEYARALKQILDGVGASLNHIQQDLNEARRQLGAKTQQATQAKTAYEQKLQEPEFIPARSAHRAQARTRLEASGIPALPLYMLIDFAPQIDSQTPLAGAIEHMLEDAGLLDALVVLPASTDAADALLTTEGLSDCRLQLQRLGDGNRGQNGNEVKSSLLSIDPALREAVGADYPAWEEIATAILDTIESTVFPSGLQQAWAHGLLTGRAGEGVVRCIGKATRVREQQRQQECLRQQWETLENERKEIEYRVEHLEQEHQEQEVLRERLNNVLQESMVEVHYTALQATLETLNKAEERYQQARSASQNLRQQIAAMRIRLQKEAAGGFLFTTDAAKVEQAYETTNKLASEHKTLISYIQRLLSAWQSYKRTEQQLAQAKSAEWRAEQAKQKAEQALTRASIELDTLQKLARETEQVGIDALLAQLQELQARQKSLPDDLQKTRDQRAKAENTRDISQEEHSKALTVHQDAEQQCNNTYQYFLTFLDAYPVEMLMAVRQQINIKTHMETAQSVLSEPIELDEVAYLARKKELQAHETRAQNELFHIYGEVLNLLHAYGPQVDDDNIIRFANAEHANPYELLTRLGEEIRHNEQLLDAREHELFQNFLLEEMAETVGKHITDAEKWVARMNAVLAESSFVGEYYHLRWVPRAQDKASVPGSYLAQHHALLRRQAQTLKQEEIDTLVHAFKQEVAALGISQQTTNEATFAEALARALDYRTWFQFEIYITRADGSLQHLTNRFFKKGSGAEQYVTLYVPFLAALSALYESAGSGAPRLIALDEAFDKVSLKNTRNLLKFLASQHFQWIMTGPRVTGEGAEIPACVKYTMFCQKEDELATGYPSFWSGQHAE